MLLQQPHACDGLVQLQRLLPLARSQAGRAEGPGSSNSRQSHTRPGLLAATCSAAAPYQLVGLIADSQHLDRFFQRLVLRFRSTQLPTRRILWRAPTPGRDTRVPRSASLEIAGGRLQSRTCCSCSFATALLCRTLSEDRFACFMRCSMSTNASMTRS